MRTLIMMLFVLGMLGCEKKQDTPAEKKGAEPQKVTAAAKAAPSEAEKGEAPAGDEAKAGEKAEETAAATAKTEQGGGWATEEEKKEEAGCAYGKAVDEATKGATGRGEHEEKATEAKSGCGGDNPPAGCGGCGDKREEGACAEGEKKAEEAAATDERAEEKTGDGHAGHAGGGCGAHAENADAPTTVDGVTHFGSAFTMDSPTKLSEIVAKADEHTGKTVKVAAKISKVCKKKGCWFVLQNDAQDGSYVRVTMKDHAFFVPKDCDGKDSVVEGTFHKVDLPEAARKHLAEDGGEDPAKVKGGGMELTLVATAVDIIEPVAK